MHGLCTMYSNTKANSLIQSKPAEDVHLKLVVNTNYALSSVTSASWTPDYSILLPIPILKQLNGEDGTFINSDICSQLTEN